MREKFRSQVLPPHKTERQYRPVCGAINSPEKRETVSYASISVLLFPLRFTVLGASETFVFPRLLKNDSTISHLLQNCTDDSEEDGPEQRMSHADWDPLHSPLATTCPSSRFLKHKLAGRNCLLPIKMQKGKGEQIFPGHSLPSLLHFYVAEPNQQ